MFKITIIALGTKMPDWVSIATGEFSKRLQEFVNLTIYEIPLAKRGKSSDLARILEKEAGLMAAAIPHGVRLIALDITGNVFSSEKLALKLQQLPLICDHLCFLIGGPEGIASSLVAKANERWSLSALTLPHPLVRIILLEALYRAFAILNNHPYHK